MSWFLKRSLKKRVGLGRASRKHCGNLGQDHCGRSGQDSGHMNIEPHAFVPGLHMMYETKWKNQGWLYGCWPEFAGSCCPTWNAAECRWTAWKEDQFIFVRDLVALQRQQRPWIHKHGGQERGGLNINLQVNKNRRLIKAMTLSRNWVNTEKTRNQRSEPQYFIGRDEEEQREKSRRRQMGSTNIQACHVSIRKKAMISFGQVRLPKMELSRLQCHKDHHRGWGVGSVISIFFSLWDAWGSISSSTWAGIKCPALSNRNGVGNSDRIKKDLSHWEFKGNDMVNDGNNEDTDDVVW